MEQRRTCGQRAGHRHGALGEQIDALTSVPIERLSFDRFEAILPAERYAQVLAAAERSRKLLEGRVIWNVNSTARGGGVAEMLISLLSYAQGVGVDARWVVISGNVQFFALTKRIHNNLHSAPGDGGELGDAERRIYEQALHRHGVLHTGLWSRGVDPRVFAPRYRSGAYRAAVGAGPDDLVVTYPFEDINRAIDDVLAGRVVKPVLVW